MPNNAVRKIDRVKGWGADLDFAKRPGVPMEPRPEPAAGVHWQSIARQRETVEVLRRVGLKETTPVFGTGQPPHGLSGWLRRKAYAIPDHKAAHWMLLLFSDRVDAIESAIGERKIAPTAVVTSATLISGAFLLTLAWRVFQPPEA